MSEEQIESVGIEMGSRWKVIALGDVIDVKHGYAFNGKHIVETPTNKILVTPRNFHIGGGFKSSNYKYYNSDFPSDYILKPKDIVVTMTDLSQETDTLLGIANTRRLKKRKPRFVGEVRNLRHCG